MEPNKQFTSPEGVIGNAMRTGLATTLLKRASLEGFIKHLDSLDAIKRVKPTEAYYRYQGLRPPHSSDGYYGEQWGHIKTELGKLRDVPAYSHTRDNPEMKALIDDDIKHGRFTRLETGTNKQNANNIIRRGPSNSVGGHETRFTGFDKNSESRGGTPQSKRYQQVHYAIEDNKSRDYLDIWRRKQDSGLYAARAGTSRTRDYAHRAGSETNPPVKLSFDIPSTLAQAPAGKEQIVPRFNWEYTRNHTIEDI